MERNKTHRLVSKSIRGFYLGGAALALMFTTSAFADDAPVGPKAEVPVVAKSPETTSERLLGADKEQQNWITHHKDYNAQRFSSLDQINAGNVKGLKVAWTMQLGGLEGGACSRSKRRRPAKLSAKENRNIRRCSKVPISGCGNSRLLGSRAGPRRRKLPTALGPR